MHKKIIGTEKSLSVKTLYGISKYNDLSKKIKNMPGFENIKNNEMNEKRYNSLGNEND